MEKKIVGIGEQYWFASLYSREGLHTINEERGFDKVNITIGNRFSTKAEAEQMARKLHAVLAGADVIEMPPKCEIVKMADEWEINTTYASADSGSFIEGIEWLKSKIIK